MLQLLEYKPPAFRLLINGVECTFYPPKTMFVPWQFLPMHTKVKGSTMGWNIKKFVSYNQVKKVIKPKQKKHK